MSEAPRRTMQVRVSTPIEARTLDGVLHLRFTAVDGQRGVMPGHEPALATVSEGLIELRLVDAAGAVVERFLGCEEGLIRIDPSAVEIAARWAAEAPTLDDLRAAIVERARARAAIEAEARALAHRREVAIQEALNRLTRSVDRG